MRILFKYLIIIACIYTSTGCERSPAEMEAVYIENRVAELAPTSDKKWIVVLPGLGCKGCIQEGEEFLKNYVSYDNILFVLTKVESIKLLQQKVGHNLVGRSNIIIDHTDSFELPSKNSIYPLIIELDNSKMKAYQFQSPENSVAFSRLGDEIQNL